MGRGKTLVQSINPWLVDGVLASVVPFMALLVLNASLVREVRRSVVVNSVDCLRDMQETCSLQNTGLQSSSSSSSAAAAAMLSGANVPVH